jgi:hypothetical protein
MVHIGNFVTTVIHSSYNQPWQFLPTDRYNARLCPMTSASAYRHPRPSTRGLPSFLVRTPLQLYASTPHPARNLEPSCMLGDPHKTRLGLQMHAQWHLFGGRRQMHRAYAPFVRWVILATGPQAAFMTCAEFLGPARHQVRASVTLTHPCQHAAAHLPCTRPPDAFGSSLDRPRTVWTKAAAHLVCTRPQVFVTFRRFFTVLSATAPSSSRLRAHPSCWFTHVGRPAGRPRTPDRIHSEDHIISQRFSPPSTGCIYFRFCFCKNNKRTIEEGTPPCLSTGNFYFLTLADIFSPDYFLPLCYRTPPYYWERTSSVCIMHLYSVYGPPPTLILPAYFYLSLYAHPYVLSLYQGYIFGGLSIWP